MVVDKDQNKGCFISSERFKVTLIMFSFIRRLKKDFIVLISGPGPGPGL